MKMTILCLLAVVGFVAFCGCAAYNEPESQRRRAHTVKADIEHMADDIDWVLGLHRPTKSFDESMR